LFPLMPNTKRARRTPRTRPTTAAEAVVDDPANDGDKGVAASAVAPLEARFLADLSQLYDDDDDDDEEDEVDQDGKVVGKRDWLLDRPALRLSKQPPMTTATTTAATTTASPTITEEEEEENEEDEEVMPSQQSADEGSAPSRRPDALLAQPEEGSTTRRRRRRRIGGALSPLGSVDVNAPPRRERGAHVKGTIDDQSGDVTKTATMAEGEPPAALTPEQMQQGTMPIAKRAGGRTRTMFLTLHHP
jgi:hypothetical protein